MKFDMVMPKMGESITEGTIIKWLKNVGDLVEKDEIVLEISTDKVDSEIPVPVSGKIIELLGKENETIEVGNVIARIETEASETDASPAAAPQEKAEEKPAVDKVVPQPAPVPAPAESQPMVETPAEKITSTKFFSPVVLNIARTEGISSEELESINGTGMNGRVTKKDVLGYIESRKSGATSISVTTGVAGEGVEIIPMNHIRKKIAEHMVHTVRTAAHVGLFIEVDMQNVTKIREGNKNNFYKKEGVKLTLMPFISEAVVKTLKEFPLINASLEGDKIIVKHFISLGIAVDTEQGLIVPVIKNTDALNLVGISRAINDLAARARSRKLKPDEVSGGTFSISNFGVFGTKIGFPLINQPQLAILGVGSLEKRAVVVNDAIAIRPMMDISLTFDHRLIDGAMGARFLQKLKEHLEDYDPDTRL